MAKASKEIKEYFKKINDDVNVCYDLAAIARKKGLDPEEEVPIPLAKNMAERVVGLISVVAPQIINTGITDRITELEKEYGMLDWRVGFKIAEEVAKQIFCKFDTKKEAMEVGIRLGFSYLTLGIVSAPLEGFIGLNIKKRKDGKEYFALQYAGPIRAAGGTASSVSVILSDYVRVKMGYAAYDPDEKEVSRYTSEIHDYHDRATNLQYHPSDDELKFLISNLPVEVDGDPTEKIQVSNYKDLPRIETNFIRGGVALVLAEGLSQKTPKLWKRLGKWGKEMGLEHWKFLGELIKIKERVHADHGSDKKEKSDDGLKKKKEVKANNTFIMDIVAGRPIFTHPLRTGGFRLRYGRNRTSGFSSSALHAATLVVLDKFLAVGTQMKMERPGKATTVTLCDTLEGPIVLLNDGSVLQLHDEKEAKENLKDIKEILFLGDILFNYGDFSENGAQLVPVGYCSEWWTLELEKAVKEMFPEEINKEDNKSKEEFEKRFAPRNFSLLTSSQLEKLSKSIKIEIDRLNELINKPLFEVPTFKEAIKLSKSLKIALHPDYTFYWKLISKYDILRLTEWFKEGKIKFDEKGIKKIILPYSEKNEMYQKSKRILDELGVTHQIINKENLIIPRKEAKIFAFCLGFKDQETLFNINEIIKPKINIDEIETGLDLLNNLEIIEIKDKAGTFVGARMGRPEKGKMRIMKGSPHVMFPVGEEGGRLRSFQAALEKKNINGDFCNYHCEKCNKDMIYPTCEECGEKCIQKYYCRECGDINKESCRHGDASKHKRGKIDINYYMDKARVRLKEANIPELIKGVRGTSNKDHVVEHLSKGILRAKHKIHVNKDGTVRYDCTELPLTHFKPKEIHTSVEKLKEIGYIKDIFGDNLINDNQILEMKPQDIIIPGYDSLEDSAPKVFTRVANFIDELLVKFYGLEPFYNIKKNEDLVGHLVIGLAPHISAGMVGRIIGYSETQGLITHPMYHAGLRRDCDGDEASVNLLLDSLLNFSRQYLPERRGAKTMDACLVLTSVLVPSEVDDQVLGVDVEWRYPLEFYEAALEMKKPWEIKYGTDQRKIEQINDRLDTPLQYEKMGFTHHVDNFNKTVLCSAYKTLPTMVDKMDGQMKIAQKVRAVDMGDVAKLIIQKHFLKDIKGNFRKYSMQQFRCVKCNTKYRRPPLNGNCSNCHGKLIFTISEGSVIKYLIPSLMLSEKYEFSPYLKETLDLLKLNVDNVFGKEKDKQVGLGSFVNEQNNK